MEFPQPPLTCRLRDAARPLTVGIIASVVLLGCAGESKPGPGAEACLGSSAPLKMDVKGYGSIGLPAEEPDLQAWVVKEQSGLAALTTRPCAAKPPTRLLRIPSDAPIVQVGQETSKPTLAAGQRVRVWFEGGSSGTARAVMIERVASWPPAGQH